MKRLFLTLLLAHASWYVHAAPPPHYSCEVYVDIVDLNSTSQKLVLSNSEITGYVTREDGSRIKPYRTFKDDLGRRVNVYDIGLSFSLIQQIDSKYSVRYSLSASSIVDPDPLYGVIYLLQTADYVNRSLAKVLYNGATFTLKTQESKTKGELFYAINCYDI